MKELKSKCIEFLSYCDGYHEILKGLHWGATHHAEHILTDDIDGSVLEYQDKIAECVMGITDSKFGVGRSAHAALSVNGPVGQKQTDIFFKFQFYIHFDLVLARLRLAKRRTSGRGKREQRR